MDNFLKDIPLFADLSEADLAHLRQVTTRIHLPQGAELFKEGSPGDQAYVIREGEIEIFTHSGERELYLAIRKPYEVIGEMALLDGAPRMASARARTDSVLLAISQEQFEHLLKISPAAARHILYDIVPRWRSTELVLRDRDQQIREQSQKLEQTLLALQQAHAELEQRVQKRTAELAQANAILTEQIREREWAERELTKYREHLEELVQYRTAELKTANQKLQALNERLQGEMAMARRIQQSLLLAERPGWSSPQVVCYSAPAQEVGGDFYAYHAFPCLSPFSLEEELLENGRFALAVGDVSGKGMPAALLMAVSLASFQSIIAQALKPSLLLTSLDQVIAPYTLTTQQSCALCCVEIEGNLLRVANAGCIPPLVRQADGTVTWVDVGGLPLGVNMDLELGYQEVTLPLNRGDLVILTSDGVVEAQSATNELFGFQRLEEAVTTAPATDVMALLTHLRAEVSRFIGSQELYDDMTIVVLQR